MDYIECPAYPFRYLQGILASKSAAAKALATNCQHTHAATLLSWGNNVANETIKECRQRSAAQGISCLSLLRIECRLVFIDVLGTV